MWGTGIGMHTALRVKLSELATRRNRVFAGLQRNRPLSKGYEEIGLLGEWEFATFCGVMPKLKAGGDGGIDFELPVVFTVDVKTARKGDRLLVEEGKVKADIYVLAHYDEGRRGDVDTGDNWTLEETRLVGWTSAAVIKSIEACDSGRGIINHVVPAERLRPMEELAAMMGKMRRG